jgi:hypothetical protein
MNGNGFHPISASNLWAASQGTKNEGRHQCHWCGDPCSEAYPHDDPPIAQFVRRTSTARCPANHWTCVGCYLWRRDRVTVQYLDGVQKDIQSVRRHSWWITEKGAWALRPVNGRELYEKLLLPPKRFILAILINGPVASGLAATNGTLNHVHQAHANDVGGGGLNTEEKQMPNTQYIFTVNNIPHHYSPLELEAALRGGDGNGMEPGTQALMRLLGGDREWVKELTNNLVPEMPPKVVEEAKAGRPVGTPRLAGEYGKGKRDAVSGKK